MRLPTLPLGILFLCAACATQPAREKAERPVPAGTAQVDSTAEIVREVAPDTLAGCKLSYSEGYSRFVYTFSKDGSFRYIAVARDESTSDSRQGTYEYTVPQPGKGVIRFNELPTISLTFSDRQNAIGQVGTEPRKYQFSVTYTANE